MPSVNGEGMVCSELMSCAHFHLLFGTFRTVHPP